MALPNTLTNGTLADADEVMENMNYNYGKLIKYLASSTTEVNTTSASYSTKRTYSYSSSDEIEEFLIIQFDARHQTISSSSSTTGNIQITVNGNQKIEVGVNGYYVPADEPVRTGGLSKTLFVVITTSDLTGWSLTWDSSFDIDMDLKSNDASDGRTYNSSWLIWGV